MQTKAQVRADLGAASNGFPQAAVSGGVTVSIHLTYDTGRNPALQGLLDAIESFYGVGKIVGQNDSTGHGVMHLKVLA